MKHRQHLTYWEVVIANEIYDGVRSTGMFTNQLSWFGPFGFVVTLPSYGAGGPGSVPTVGMCGGPLSFQLHL
jgi:hypothetical protein